MIHVQRVAEPQVLRRNAKRWTQQLRQARTDSEKRKIQRRYNRPQVRKALADMFHGKCAYCESHIAHIDYGNIEHYRPKSKFPHLTFTWDNLLLACGFCNGTRQKGDRFPGRAQGGPIIDPCNDQPQEHFDFHYDPELHLASVYALSTRGETTGHLLGLNRKELRGYRSRQVRKLVVLEHLAREHEDAQARAEAEALLSEACSAAAEYAAFARTLFPRYAELPPQAKP